MVSSSKSPDLIDVVLAEYLGLVDNASPSDHNALPSYSIDIDFIEPELSSVHGVVVKSTNTKFDMRRNDKRFQGNIGMLIGRDLMSHWNIVWDGVASTVRIIDHRHSRSSEFQSIPDNP